MNENVIPEEFIKKYNPYILHTGGKTVEDIFKETKQHKNQNIFMVGEGPSEIAYIDNLEQVIKIKDNEFISYFKNRIHNIVSVAVHVRRTDFVILGVETEYAYYEASIGYMESRFPNAIFFFSLMI